MCHASCKITGARIQLEVTRFLVVVRGLSADVIYLFCLSFGKGISLEIEHILKVFKTKLFVEVTRSFECVLPEGPD